ncbi:MAG: DEAD/DEAH box helicase, partial [Symploca sp. SIO2B6]|nr:DEAD/DEAH box helicase [Symploca sp. SIO2B6]
MAQSTFSANPRFAKLLKTYHQLSPFRQRVLQVFAIAYTPIARTKALECINHAGIKDDDGNKVSISRLKLHIDALLSIDLLKQERGKSAQCNALIVEAVTREAIEADKFELIADAVGAVVPIPQRYRNGPRMFEGTDQFLREVRLAIYRNRFDLIDELFDDYYKHSYSRYGDKKLSMRDIVLQIFNNPFDVKWMQTLPSEWHDEAIATILTEAELYRIPVDEPFQYLVALCRDEVDSDAGGVNGSGNGSTLPKRSNVSNYLRFILAQHLICRGQFQQAESVLEQVSNQFQDSAAVFWGWLSFLKGDIDEAIAHYTVALVGYRKAKRKKKAYFNTVGGVFFILALIKEGSSESLAQAREYAEFIAKQKGHWLEQTYDSLSRVIRIQQGDASQRSYIAIQAQTNTIQAKRHSFEHLIRSLCFYWVDREKATKTLAKQLKPICDSAKSAGFDWLAMELADLLSHTTGGKSYAKIATAFLDEHPTFTPLTHLIRPLEAWEISLKALTNLKKEAPTAATTDAEKRMAWMVTLYGNHSWLLQPREQKVTKAGKWGKGRNIALKRLHDDREQFDYLSAHDHNILSHLKIYRSYSGYYGSNMEYSFAPEAMTALIGHPCVFWEDSPTVRVDVVKGEPELLVEDKGNGYLNISFSLKPTGDKPISLTKESPTRLKVIEITDDYHRIASILGSNNKLTVPISAKDQVLGAINSISSLVTVHSDIGGGMESVEEVPADATPHIHLLPSGEGLNVSLLCRPFSEAGPYYTPGTGGKNVIAEIEGQRLQTNRNLQQERDLAQAVVMRCSPLVQYGEEETEWLLGDPEECLELLFELQDLNEIAVVEWPEGQTMNIRHQAGFGNFHVNIGQQQDWFAATGELKLDDDDVINMRQLMALLEQTNSRFIPIGDGEFIALTNEFRKRLDELRSFAEQHGEGLRFHPLASLAIDDMFEDMEHVKADKHWKANIKKIREMESFQPKLPSTLQADLRDYQQEGFEWMARLAYWGVGACLADDMGLGKTLQALSVLLTRAPNGPALIIAPTSVGMNWISEAQKFAPTLNPVQFGSGDRQKLLDTLKPFDMLVCTYGLLQQDDVAEMLAGVEWEMIVLDEAQAIKNANTKRSKAAMTLQSSFKVLTTGTPIENHLGELWNLFRFINPGLLGSMDKFNQKFAYPIERDENKPARNRLKKLISPFILRRTKSQVLDELPSRTEITLQVEMSKDEMAMYEALRREAVDRIADSGAEGGAKHLQVLAEIMKLRRMCCNPKLILPETDLTGAKLELFGETLEELLENRHKALVFSQFVDHLTIIKNYLEEKNIRYQYLDGKTPAKARKQRVDAFQSGDGDVFLISLKAGGTGLNLTAADYVIHMDPWWNPAVEDQASDRAHRIGQKRPVTIYRLVTKGTIEEKIVALHAQKRDLADSLLDGTD